VGHSIFLYPHPPTHHHPLSSTVMATSAMKPSLGVSRLDMFPLCHNMMSFPAPAKKPICAKYRRGECNGLRCPYFHPKDLVSHLRVAP